MKNYFWCGSLTIRRGLGNNLEIVAIGKFAVKIKAKILLNLEKISLNCALMRHSASLV